MAAGMYRYRYLARATTHGVFIVPPTKAEEMYTPEVFGRSGADVTTVGPKP
jgi:alpha-2-macroglobulin